MRSAAVFPPGWTFVLHYFWRLFYFGWLLIGYYFWDIFKKDIFSWGLFSDLFEELFFYFYILIKFWRPCKVFLWNWRSKDF